MIWDAMGVDSSKVAWDKDIGGPTKITPFIVSIDPPVYIFIRGRNSYPQKELVY